MKGFIGMKSMTGFGASEYSDEVQSISLEIKTVNHRYKDISFRLSRKLAGLEDTIRKIISSRLSRGHVEVFAKYTGTSAQSAGIKYDGRLARAYFDILNQMGGELSGIDTKISVNDIARFPNVITAEDTANTDEELTGIIKRMTEEALDMVEASRISEGEALKEDFLKRVRYISDKVSLIKELSDQIPKGYYDTLMKNISEYTKGILSEERLATEIAIYADRVNISEELVRLNSHTESFNKALDANEPIGRKLDFMLQEINREVNTIASKSNSFEISSLVVDIKAELEKIREQVQNIE
ncbi:MAG: YicC family protein [Eubacteriaceae bacterium]|nr:YicC family protein [Eubacteriaceae bacterium]